MVELAEHPVMSWQVTLMTRNISQSQRTTVVVLSTLEYAQGHCRLAAKPKCDYEIQDKLYFYKIVNRHISNLETVRVARDIQLILNLK